VDKNMITRDETRTIAAQPFKDFNLTHDEIPLSLQVAMANPYAPPKPYRCDEIQIEVADLNTLLGPDFDTPHDPDSGVTRAKLLDAARNEASSWIPLRSLVRWASGADRHAREMRRAVLAGQVRRAYLKGLREKLRCRVVTADRKAAPPRKR
jgi:hypothetical protein